MSRERGAAHRLAPQHVLTAASEEGVGSAGPGTPTRTPTAGMRSGSLTRHIGSGGGGADVTGSGHHDDDKKQRMGERMIHLVPVVIVLCAAALWAFHTDVAELPTTDAPAVLKPIPIANALLTTKGADDVTGTGATTVKEAAARKLLSVPHGERADATKREGPWLLLPAGEGKALSWATAVLHHHTMETPLRGTGGKSMASGALSERGLQAAQEGKSAGGGGGGRSGGGWRKG